LKTEDKTINLA